MPVVSGVPQQTVLGPLLFITFTNDIVDEVKSEIRLFADNCVCYRAIVNVQDCEQLQKDIDHLPYYMKFWRHFNLAILAIFQKIAKLKCTKIKCR